MRSDLQPERITVCLLAGCGDGQRCVCCEQPITRRQVQYTLVLESSIRSTTCDLHADCFEAWQRLLSASRTRLGTLLQRAPAASVCSGRRSKRERLH